MLFLININGELRKVAGSICNAIYSLISILFDVFYSLANIRILNARYEVDGVWHDAPITIIYKRVTLLLGIIMVFYVTFQFIKYVLEPDTFSDKEKGGEKLVFKLIAVVVLMGTVPTIFDKAYDIQRLILNSHLIDKVLIGHTDTEMSSFGKSMSASVFSLFYYLDDVTSKDFDCKNGITCQETINMNISNLATTGSMPMITSGLGIEVNDNKFAIHFDAWFAMGVGLFLCYILVLYVIDIGVRVAQLTYLQIIAPIPIISYLSPKKDGMFQKWVKQCVVTFLDVFIRLFIIYFMLLVISNINISSIGESINANVDETTKTWVYIALILGLLLFAQKAPKLIQELFPNMGAAMGNFGLKPGDRMPALAAKAAAMGLGGASALARKTIGRTANAIKHNRREKKAAGIDDYKQKKKDYRKAKRDKLNPPEIKAAKDAKEKAKAAYKENYGGNKQKLKAAKKKYKDAKKTGVSAVIEEARKSLHEERDKYQTAKHKKDSITGAFLSGVVTGPVTGIIQGSKAKDLKSISSAVKSASKTASQQVKAHSEWKEQGGEHATGRIIEGVKSHFGIESGIESQKREQDAVQRSIESSEEALKRAQRPAEQSSAMKKALEKPKEVVDAEMAKPGKIKTAVGKDITGVTGSAQMEPAKVLSKLEANVTEAEAKLQAAENTKNPRDINKAKRALEEARTNLSKGKKDINNAINDQVLNGILQDNRKVDDKLIEDYGIEIVTAMKDTISTVTNMSRDSALMAEIKDDLTIPEDTRTAFIKTFYDGHGNLLAKPNFDGYKTSSGEDVSGYEQMKKVKDYLQLYSSNKTRSNEELRLNIEDRKYDLEREKNNASRRYEANAKNPIGSGYTGGSSGK